jgi:hypothetical protein
MKKNCDCVCHKLGYIYCGAGHCPDHEAFKHLAAPENEIADDYERNEHQ